MGAKELSVTETPIPGLLVIDLPVHGDARGWFKENWQREKMVALGLPDFGPVQNNISFNAEVGVTRGIHAEPWDKFISVGYGRVFGAWVDLREGPTFGAKYWTEITPEKAIFVPRGVGNSFQTVEAPAVYTYLVNDHWSADKQGEYTFLNLADDTVAIPWPIPLSAAELSDKDLQHPRLEDVKPCPVPRTWRASSVGSVAPSASLGQGAAGQGAGVQADGAAHQHSDADGGEWVSNGKTLVVGAGGQLGRALQGLWLGREDVNFVDRSTIDLADQASIDAFDFTPYSTIVNAAAYTAVDQAETAEGRRAAWAVNVTGVSALVSKAREAGAILVHVSSDYVFDGSYALHSEDEEFAPLGVYGQTKAAGDAVVAGLERHYIVRTSWVVGDGANFVSTMASLAERGVDPKVVCDQVGRLSFASEIARAIDHLLRVNAGFGTYNVSNSGDTVSWFDVAQKVFALTGHDPQRVTGVSTVEYFGDKTGIAPRPLNSAFVLDKIMAIGFSPRDQFEALDAYLRG